jgi:hypothetical protein
MGTGQDVVINAFTIAYRAVDVISGARLNLSDNGVPFIS